MTSAHAEHQSAAHRLLSALANWDLDAYEALLAEDAVETRPQLNERFVGRHNIMGMYRSLPAGPRVEWSTILAGDDHCAAEGTIHYGDGWDHLVAMIELREGKMVRGAYYFASQLATSPPYHAAWAEKTPTPEPRPPRT